MAFMFFLCFFKWADQSVLAGVLLLPWLLLLIAGLFRIFAAILRRSPPPPRHHRTAANPLQFLRTGPPGRGLLGLQKSEIEALMPTFVYSKRSRRKEGWEHYCAVCLSEFEEQEKGRSLQPKCCHSFHAACIDVWFITNSTCPLCRSEVGCKETKLPIANYCTDQAGSAFAAAALQITAPDPDQAQELASAAATSDACADEKQQNLADIQCE